MNKKLNAIVIALALVAGLWFGLTLHKTQLAQPVQAQDTETNQVAMRRWEHCSVFPVNGVYKNAGKVTGTAVISYMRGGGYQSEKVEATVNDSASSMSVAQSNALAKAVSKLGDEGWEMVGEGTLFPDSSSNQKVLYFRRAKK